MPARITITHVTFQAAPAVAQTLTFRVRPQGNPAWLQEQTGVAVQSTGALQTALVFGGLPEGYTYEVQAVNECGDAVYTTTIDAPSSGQWTFRNQTHRDITSLRLNGTHIGTVLAGQTKQFGQLGGGADVVHAVFAGVGEQLMVVEYDDNTADPVERTYLHIPDGSPGTDLLSGVDIAAGDTVTAVYANRHLDEGEYTYEPGALSGACVLTGGKIVRSEAATADATAQSHAVAVTYTVSADNGEVQAGQVANFGMGDSQRTVSKDLSAGGACTQIYVTIVSIT